ncbi:MAG: TIGR04076 family protein [Candidatus Hadarchaeota archaeon]
MTTFKPNALDMDFMTRYRIIATVKDIDGKCPIHSIGDGYLIEEDGQSLKILKGERLCTYALSSMLPFFSALSKELEDDDWMASESHLFQCPDPGPQRGGVATVYFEIKREKV